MKLLHSTLDIFTLVTLGSILCAYGSATLLPPIAPYLFQLHSLAAIKALHLTPLLLVTLWQNVYG